MAYNGHKNWNHWNVALWIGNDEGLYNLARSCIRSAPNRRGAASAFINIMESSGSYQTPDGAPWSKSAVLAAFVGM